MSSEPSGSDAGGGEPHWDSGGAWAGSAGSPAHDSDAGMGVAQEESAWATQGMFGGEVLDDTLLDVENWENVVATLPQQTTLRCIDPECTAPCTRCTSAPGLGEERDVELRGHDKKKNGLKLLRALIARTQEWNSTSERERLACAAEGQQVDELATVLRAKRTSLLRKRHLLFLCRAWGYRSYIWTRRGERALGAVKRECSPAGAASPTLPRAAANAVAVWDGCTFNAANPQPEALYMYAVRALRPLLSEASQMYAGSAARAAAAGGSDHIGAITIQEVNKVSQYSPLLLAQLGAALSTLQIFEAEVPEENKRQIAWRGLTRHPDLRLVETLVQGSTGALSAIVKVTEDRLVRP